MPRYEINYDHTAAVYELWFVTADYARWIGAYDTRAEALNAVEADKAEAA